MEVGAVHSDFMQKLWKGRNTMGNAQPNPSEQKERSNHLPQALSDIFIKALLSSV